MSHNPFLPDPEQVRAAHARLSALCRASFHSPLKISAELEREAAKGDAVVRVMTALADGETLTLTDLRDETNLGRDALRATLSSLIERGHVTVQLGMYGHKSYRSRLWID